MRDITVEHGAHAPLVDALLAMARSLSLNTVAEGVESDLQLQYLRSRGATQVQGFLFSRPLPLEELLAEHDSWTGASTATLKVAGDPR